MPQIKKNLKVMKLDASVYDKLDRFCTETVATERILDKYLADYFEQPENQRSLF